MTDPSSDQYLPADADKISAQQLTDTHVLHPGAPERFSRSTLVIGSRGSGKTFLLRHRKQTTHEGAVYVNLLKALQSLSRDAGLGGRSLTYSEPLADQIRGKTAALLAITTLELCSREVNDSLDSSLALFDHLLPVALRSTRRLTAANARELRRAVNVLPLTDWPPLPDTSAFSEVFGELSNLYPYPLTLLLDRAEDVPLPSVHLLTQMLDQSFEVLTVIAARPGVSQLLPVAHDPTLVPGDHYDILHLGLQPYQDSWSRFVDTAVRNFLESNQRRVPSDFSLAWAISLARDSLRDAASFAQAALLNGTSRNLTQRADHFKSLREQRLARARAVLYPDVQDFGLFVKTVQAATKLALASRSQFALVIEFEDDDAQISLLGPGDRRREILLSAIRAEALYLAPGFCWHPYELPNRVELAPLLAWNGENTQWIS